MEIKKPKNDIFNVLARNIASECLVKYPVYKAKIYAEEKINRKYSEMLKEIDEYFEMLKIKEINNK